MAKRREYHPFAKQFPRVEGIERERIKEDIQKNNLIHQIVLDDKGLICDGITRYELLLELGIDPEPYTWEKDFRDEAHKLEYIYSQNLRRRQMNKGQIAAAEVYFGKRLAEIESEAKERQRGGAKTPTNGEEQKNCTTPTKGKANNIAGKESGTNGEYVRIAKALKKEAPDLLEQVMGNALTIMQAKDEMSRRKRSGEISTAPKRKSSSETTSSAKREAPSKSSGTSEPAVPQKVAKAFEAKFEFEAQLKTLKTARKAMEQLLDGPGAAWMSRDRILNSLDNAIANVKLGLPHCVCGECGGNSCRHCKEHGYWNADRAKAAKAGAAA